MQATATVAAAAGGQRSDAISPIGSSTTRLIVRNEYTATTTACKESAVAIPSSPKGRRATMNAAVDTSPTTFILNESCGRPVALKISVPSEPNDWPAV